MVEEEEEAELKIHHPCRNQCTTQGDILLFGIVTR